MLGLGAVSKWFPSGSRAVFEPFSSSFRAARVPQSEITCQGIRERFQDNFRAVFLQLESLTVYDGWNGRFHRNRSQSRIEFDIFIWMMAGDKDTQRIKLGSFPMIYDRFGDNLLIYEFTSTVFFVFIFIYLFIDCFSFLFGFTGFSQDSSRFFLESVRDFPGIFRDFLGFSCRNAEDLLRRVPCGGISGFWNRGRFCWGISGDLRHHLSEKEDRKREIKRKRSRYDS